MGDERSNRISDLYDRALAHPPAERARFLQDACGNDDALRREVASLLEFEAWSERFLERPAAAMPAAWRTEQASQRRRKSQRKD